jgi:hypothetical protein
MCAKGNYCRLPRFLFYVTIAAAVLLRNHFPWLYLGALAASLTYSGAAAIHACLLVSRGPAWGELDLYALLAILSVSCIVMVPLLNWSSTIRNAGRPNPHRQLNRDNQERSDDNKDFNAASRIIFISWSLLVTVGLVCAFIAFQDPTLNRRWGHWTETVSSGAQSFSCAPESGVLNVTAGQPSVQISLNFFIVTQEFVDQNNCQSPCSDPIGGTALFRTETDLILPTENECFSVIAGLTESASQAREQALIVDYANKSSYVIVYVLIQGIWTVCFGRYTPSQTRTILYGFFSRLRLSKRDPEYVGTLQRVLSQAIALAAYSGSVIVVVIAIPLLVVNMVVIEIYLRKLPQSENSVHVGAWSPYASTVLVLFAAAFAKSYETLKEMAKQSGGNVWKLLQIIWPGHQDPDRPQPTINHDAYADAARRAKNVLMATLEFIFGIQFRKRIVHEWHGLIEFCKDPEISYHEFRDPAQGKPVCECPADYVCALHPECSHHRVCANKTECKDCPACNGTPGHHECHCKGHKDHFVTLPVKVSEGLEPKTATTQISSTNIPSSQGTNSSRDSMPQRDPVPTQATNLPRMRTI